MLRRPLMGLGALLLTACAQTHAKDSPPSLDSATNVPNQGSSLSQEMLSRLVGRWVLTGVIAGQSTVHDVQAAWVLQRNYVRISEISREKSDNGQPVYEAEVFVGWLKDHYVCIWLDNTEVASGEVTCSAANVPDSIPLEFRDAKGALVFTNTFVYNRAHDTWEWRMANIRDGDAHPFGAVTLSRR